jgi:O-acetyl-ADP-ribose deacetylase (regulator of RNase III)
MKYVKGNLLNMLDEFDVVLHGCNIFHTMGAGIAEQFKLRYPQVYAADVENTIYGDRNKIGTCSRSRVGNTDVLNCYTQFEWRKSTGHMNFDYDAFRSVLKLVKEAYHGKKIGMPQLGAGLASGDWKEIEKIIEEGLVDEDVTVVIYEKSIFCTYS